MKSPQPPGGDISPGRSVDTDKPGAPGNPQTGTGKPIHARVWCYRRLWTLGAVVLALDQVTKSWINARLPLGSYGAAGLEVFPGFFYLVHVGNTGAAWSMFTGQSAWLALLAIGTLVAVFFWRRHLGLPQPAAQTAFGLLGGGIVGNLIDRLLYGHVIDFLDFHFGQYVYPTFNVADSAICAGVVWYVLWSIRQPAPAGAD